MKERFNYLLLGLFALVMGAGSGVLIWALFALMNTGIEFVWQRLPQMLGLENSLIYSLAICLAAGLIIGLLQKKYGAYPETLQQVMATVKKSGGYPYNHLPLLMVMILLPLIFGGAIGPEAGLTGFVAGLWTLVCDRINYKGKQIEALTEASVAATVGIIFGAPFVGLAHSIEPETAGETYRDKLLTKKERLALYSMAIIGIFAAMKFMSAHVGGMTSLPRFARDHAIGWSQWKWSLALIALGIILAMLCVQLNKLSATFACRLHAHTVLAAVIVGALLGLIGHFVPDILFSGQLQLAALLNNWTMYSALTLFGIAVLKLAMTSLCVNLGWRGGNIFPILYAGATAAYAFALLVDMRGTDALLDGGFAVAIVAATMFGYILRKPLTAIALLLLCFPLTYLPALTVAAIVGSKFTDWQRTIQQKFSSCKNCTSDDKLYS